MRIAALCLLALAACSGPVCADEAKPNIVFILADDMGMKPRLLRANEILTPRSRPHGDRRDALSNFYAGSTVCAPTLYNRKQVNIWAATVHVMRKPRGEGQHPMEPGTITVAQLLKRVGYATAIVGKWGLGMPEDHSSPLDFGFDHYGYLCQEWHIRTIRRTSGATTSREPLVGNPPYFTARPVQSHPEAGLRA